MNPDVLLSVIVAIAGFALKTTLAFGACVALSRLIGSANFRFVIWSGFVYGTAMYWLYLANALWPLPQQSVTARTGLLQPASSSWGVWQIPESWAFPLGLTLRIIGIIYLLTLCWLIFDHLRKRHHLKWVLRFASEPPVEIAEAFQSLAKGLHAGRAKLLILPGATSPATFGWVRPTILLPTSCVEEDRFELEDILRHELHHVQRWDAVWNGLAVVSRGLLFFHPAVWYAVRKMQFDRELACDLAVVSQSPARRAEYAECLIRFARLNVIPESNGWGMDFAASADHLTVRVHSILAASKKSPGWVRCLRIASGLTISAVFLGVVPSLAVLLSFAHQPAPGAAFAPAIDIRPHRLGNEAKAGSRVRSLPPWAKGHLDSVVGSLSGKEDRPTIELPPDTRTGNLSPQSSSGPRLLHRGDPSAPGSDGARSQTVALADTDAKGQSATSGESKGAVQQTATAALGIYRRLSSVDRR